MSRASRHNYGQRRTRCLTRSKWAISVSERPEWAVFLLDRTNLIGDSNGASSMGRPELTRARAEGVGQAPFQDNVETICEDNHSIDRKASGPVFGKGLSSNVRSCIR